MDKANTNPLANPKLGYDFGAGINAPNGYSNRGKGLNQMGDSVGRGRELVKYVPPNRSRTQGGIDWTSGLQNAWGGMKNLFNMGGGGKQDATATTNVDSKNSGSMMSGIGDIGQGLASMYSAYNASQQMDMMEEQMEFAMSDRRNATANQAAIVNKQLESQMYAQSQLRGNKVGSLAHNNDMRDRTQVSGVIA